MKAARILLVPGVVMSAGCVSVGTSKLVPTHEGYNEAVQLATTGEVLKNIVRERYAGPVSKRIFFLLVDTFSTRLGSAQPSAQAPWLVLPVSGG